jgi:hypothetical protein
MEVSFSLYFITLLAILNPGGIDGSSDFNDYEEEWVDPDPFSRMQFDYASKSTKRDTRFVTCLLLLMSVILLI